MTSMPQRRGAPTGGLRKKRRIQIIIAAFVSLGIATALIGYAMRDGINFFFSPTQITENPPPETEVFRIGGLVEVGSLIREGESVYFNVTDGGAVVPVTYTGLLPDLFAENQGMIGTGRLIDGTFQATEILAKHDESYMPQEVVDALKEQGVYREADAAPATY